MKRIILLVVTAIMILNCSMSVCAEENITEESVVQNYEMKTRAVAAIGVGRKLQWTAWAMMLIKKLF